MRKLILTAAMATISLFAGAQTTPLMSKNGTPILPEKDDWSIGFDGSQLINYAGNMLSSGGKNGMMASYQEPMTIVGKMMKDENTAYRVKLRVGFTHSSHDVLVHSTSSTDTTTMVTNSYGTTAMNITLGAGMQMYRGKGRLKGFYGYEAAIMFNNVSMSNTYGEALSATNPGAHITASGTGAMFGLGVRAFVGAEYFFAPKMSIGAEYGWGLMFSNTGQGSVSMDSWDGSTVKSSTTNTGGSSSFGLDVDNASGMIFLSLYF